MRITAFQAMIPKKSFLKRRFSEHNSVYFYEHLAEHYKRKAEAFWLIRVNTPLVQTAGIISLIDVSDPDTQILPHEETIPKKVTKTKNKTNLYGAYLNPVLLLHNKNQGLQDFLQDIIAARPADLEYAEHDHRFEYWRLNDRGSVDFFQQHFEDCNKLYIADGHHRTSAQLQHWKESGDDKNRFLFAALFPIEDMNIEPYYRQIKYEGKEDQFRKIMSSFFHSCDHKDADLWMHTKHGTKPLRWIEKNALQHPKTLAYDLYGLHELVFEALSESEKGDQNKIKYISAIEPLEKIQQEMDKNSFLFEVKAVAKDDFITLSDMGYKLPPKSTLFLPRMQKGLIVHKPNV